MKIGIVPDLRPNAGGIYQYSLSILRALREWTDEGCRHEFVALTDEAQHPALERIRHSQWSVRQLTPASGKKVVKDVLVRAGLDNAARAVLRHVRSAAAENALDEVKSRPQDKRWFDSLGIQLMIYPTPATLSFEAGIPYIMAIHDLQHRLQPEFPEVSADGEWEQREYLFRNGARHARALLADSEIGKEDILNFYGEYGVRPQQVKVLPFLPAAYLPSSVPAAERQRVHDKYRLPERYLFYPAQFWPHKNHARIVRAIGLLKRESGIEAPVVFCGSAEGRIRANAYREVLELANEFGIPHLVRNLGYLPDEDMGPLYAEATALVMPTFFGPTNIPFLEAWSFGCPVLTSDIRGIREQVADAAVLIDPRSAEAMSHGIRHLWNDDQLRETLRLRGSERLSAYTPADFRRRLIDIVESAAS
jgi:glycosyltransferase involved in cell wall biosynthesis